MVVFNGLVLLFYSRPVTFNDYYENVIDNCCNLNVCVERVFMMIHGYLTYLGCL